jgi:hypothetical protein
VTIDVLLRGNANQIPQCSEFVIQNIWEFDPYLTYHAPSKTQFSTAGHAPHSERQESKWVESRSIDVPVIV